ncbi:dienelactone hydrolase family protein [Modestobacter sp. VKM Ac-2978]|uniref:dienelactone hydrolase family protein n=1 Tax=Modestobacter sp. VKM Ac-2978 TaxID=3004132 RepID=UPI0022AB19A0|nr:dienelactone hydrolase family protein [Modestobacter sp. VKM Ac-2978]MCZ2849390.1 dienelactone hydrolase family protein [Modestobacter sp. VKM Ac-2978]
MTESSSAVLAGWAPEPFTNAGITHTLHTRGSGPGLVLLPELPGLTPEVMGLAEHLVGAGFTVTAVDLFGDPGRPTSPGYAVRSSAGVCTSREFRALARRADRPAAEYVRAVARRVRDRVGGPGVGVIGMGVSGGLALASAAEPAVLAPVASQPSTPLPLTPGRRRDPGMSDRERAAVQARVTAEGLRLMGLRFSEDTAAPSDRFRALRAVFGDGWLPVSVNNRPGNEAGIAQQEHRVLTSTDAATPGHPTYEAREQVVAFLRERLAALPATARSL